MLIQRHSTPFPLLLTLLSGLFRKSKAFLASYFLAVVTLGLTIAGFSSGTEWLLIIGVAGLVVGIASIIAIAIGWHRRMRYLRPQPLSSPDLNELKLASRLQDSDYEVLPRLGKPGHGLLTSMPINDALFRGSSTRLEIDRKRFRAGHSTEMAQVLLKPFTSRKGAVLFNGRKVRLGSDILLNSNGKFASIYVQPTKYFDTLITNDSMGVRLTSVANGSELFNGREFCFPKYTVAQCDESRCANQIGASIIAVTSDNYLVVVAQSEDSVFSPGLMAPSGSGSADWRDVRRRGDLQQFVQYFARREMMEECGLKEKDVSWLKIVGYGRLLHRGGLPQFFCLAKLKCPFRRLKVKRPERRLVNYHAPFDYAARQSYRDALYEIMSIFRETETFDLVSSVLWWNLELASLISEEQLAEAFTE